MTDYGILPTRRLMSSGNKLKLGLFAANCSSGRTATTVPQRWMASWADNLRLAQMADTCGLEFMLPIARWKGYGGETDYEGTTLETLTWASGLLAATKNLTVFATVHTPLFHPVIAAKQMVTADQIGEGRFGLNIVCGWNEDEFEMFGLKQMDHATRYAQGDEWLRAIRALWREPDDFDFDGTFYHFKNARAKPKPWGDTEPIIINAGQSDDGRAFALRNCDAYFTGVRVGSFDERNGEMIPNVEHATKQISAVRSVAAAYGREMLVFSRADIWCRPTQREAIDTYQECAVEHADWVAIEGQLRLFGMKDDGSPGFEQAKRSFVRGFPIIGTPDRVAEMLGQLSALGCDGLGLSFLNYTDDFPYFRDEVLPRLERAGLRNAAASRRTHG